MGSGCDQAGRATKSDRMRLWETAGEADEAEAGGGEGGVFAGTGDEAAGVEGMGEGLILGDAGKLGGGYGVRGGPDSEG